MTDPSPEEWRPVPGYEGRYEASDHGNVRSVGLFVNSRGNGRTWRPSRMLKPTPHRQGYRMVTLTDDAGRRKTIKVCRVILLTFVGPPPLGKEDALHEDDVPTHDHLGNLRWGDQSENSHDSVRNGCHPMARKQRDRLGHLLVEPNLIPSASGRQCLACKRTNSARRNDARHAAEGRPMKRTYRSADGFQRILGESFEDEAGRRYAHIMSNYAGGA
jgi:hypothetical protein